MPPDPKTSLFDLILFIEAEINGVDISEELLAREGKKLYERMATRREHLKKVARTLELVKTHEKDFVQLIKTKAKQHR